MGRTGGAEGLQTEKGKWTSERVGRFMIESGAFKYVGNKLILLREIEETPKVQAELSEGAIVKAKQK